MPKFLIIRFNDFSDVLLTSALLRCIKKQIPHSEIHFFTLKFCHTAIEHNPNADKIFTLSHNVDQQLNELKAEAYDYIIDLQKDQNSILIRKVIGGKSFTIHPQNFKKSLYHTCHINILPQQHLAEKFIDAVKQLGVIDDGEGLNYYIPLNEETKLNDIPASHHAGYIVCAIGVLPNSERWPLKKWINFLTLLSHPVILIGSKEDRSYADEIAAVDDVKIYNACGKFSLNETADLINKSKLLISVSNNNSLVQIAAAFKKPVISLFNQSIAFLGKKEFFGKNADPKLSSLSSSTVPNISINTAANYKKCLQKLNPEFLMATVKKYL